MKKILIPLFLLGTGFMMYIVSQTGAVLKTPQTKMGIINLELANTAEKTNAVLHAWAPDAANNRTEVAEFNTYLDLLFLFFYAGLLYLLCQFIAENTRGSMIRVSLLIGNGAIIAGIADLLENAGMLISLSGNGSSAVSFLTAFFSVIKWGLVVIAVLYVLVGLLVVAYRKIRN